MVAAPLSTRSGGQDAGKGGGCSLAARRSLVDGIGRPREDAGEGGTGSAVAGGGMRWWRRWCGGFPNKREEASRRVASGRGHANVWSAHVLEPEARGQLQQ